MNTLSMVDPAARQLAHAFAAFDPSRQPIEEYRADLASAFAITIGMPSSDTPRQVCSGSKASRPTQR